MKALKLILQTNAEITPLIQRLVIGVVMLPHGAQKLLGWFGGYGFSGTMKFFTEMMHIPAPFALLAITTEFFGALALIFGLFSRVAAFGMTVLMTVAILTVHLQNGLFMNWSGKQAGEGFEYHLLMIALALGILIQGGGKWSLDGVIARKSTNV